jgi:hypothetical protein
VSPRSSELLQALRAIALADRFLTAIEALFD